MAFTETFGGTTIYPSDVSYRSISLSANQELSWPLEVATSGNVVAQIMDVTPSAGGFTITMPPANEASPGETALFFNAGSFNFTVADNAGNTIVAITPGLAYQVYLTTNTTVAGTWRTTQFGAGTSSATAGSLVGAGIKAINTTLNQSMAVTSLSVNYTAGAADRSAAFLWTGGAGTITLPAASTVGNDWFFHIRNGGTGAISLATTGGELINGTATVDFNPGDSAIIVCDGTGYFTIGFGQAPEFLFDYVSIDLTSQSSPYTLAGSNLNRIAYQFSGTLTTNMQIIVPATIQQYWVGNFTTGGSYTLTVKTSAGTGVVVPRDARAILYCNGTDVVTADTGGISIPILVSQGGTGATNASQARTNLGATSIGNALFIAADEATARNAIIAAKSGANSDITSLTGLTTPLSVPQGGTGAATFTANGLIYGSGTSALGVTAVGTTGQVLVGNTGGAPSWATLSGIGVTSFSAGTTGLTPSAATSGAITLAGTLIVANGGTGATTLTGYVKGSGTSALTASATIPATDISGGAALTKTDDTNVTLTLGGTPASALLAATSLTLGWSGQLSVARGGTGQSSYTDGQLLIGNSTGNTLTKATLTAGTNVSITNGAGSITINATDQFVGTVTSVSGTGTVNGITLTGTVTSSGSLTLGGTLSGVSLTTQVTGTLPVGNGGTGATTLTANGVLYGAGTSAIAATAVGATGEVLVGNTGGAPSWAALTGIGVTSFSAGTTGLTPNTATTGAITLAGTLGVANGGTGTATAFTAGSVVFAGASGVYSQDNANLFWDNTNDRLGIGTASPGERLTVAATANSAARITSTATTTALILDNTNANAWGSNLAIRTGGVAAGYFGTIGSLLGSTSQDITAYADTGNGFRVYTNGNNERMRIDSSGNVGIGTSSPIGKLEVVQDSGTGNVITVRNTRSDQFFIGGLSMLNAATANNFGVTIGTGVRDVDGTDSFFTINKVTSGTSYVSELAYYDLSAEFWKFSTNNTERMRIDSSGNVGIGTSAGAGRLNVLAPSTAQAINILNRSSDNGYGGIYFKTSDGATDQSIILNERSATNAASLLFYTKPDGGSTAERMRISSAGNVGIGTSAPSIPLEVTKNGTAAGSLGYSMVGKFTDGSGNKGLVVGYADASQTTVLTANSSAASSNMAFWTYEVGGSGWAERMRIDASGNVGIGLTPSVKFQVVGTARVNQSGATRYRSDWYLESGGVFLNGYDDTAAVYLPVGFNFSTYTFNSGGSERMRIDSSGNVGIGTSSITNSRLQIKGANNNVGAYADGLKVTSLNESVEAQYSWWGINANSSLQFATGGTERARIDASGNLLVGTTTNINSARTFIKGSTDAMGVQIGSTSASQGAIVFYDGSGDYCGQVQVDPSTNTTSYVTSSDVRLKDEIAAAPDAGTDIDAINVVSYSWKSSPDTHVKYGVIAQELHEVSPDAVCVGDDGEEIQQTWGVDYSKLVPMLVKEIQSLRARVAQLEGN